MDSFIVVTLTEILSLLFMYLYEKNKNKKKFFDSKIYLVLSAIPLVLLVGLRGINTGTDTKRTVEIMSNMIDDSSKISIYSSWLSYGYISIIMLVGLLFGKNYVIFNLIIAGLTIYFLFRAIDENSDNKVLSLFIFFSMCLLYQMMNQARQILAVAIILYSVKYINQKKFWRFLLIIIFAFSIHKTSIIFLPLYFLSTFKLDKKTLLIYILSFLLVFLFKDVITDLLMLTDYGQTYIMWYKQNPKAIYNLIIRVFLFLFYFFIGYNSKNKPNNIIYINLCIWCLLTQSITTYIYAFGRITTYFFVFFIFFIPNAIKNTTFSNRNSLNFITVFGFLGYYIVYYIYNGFIDINYSIFCF